MSGAMTVAMSIVTRDHDAARPDAALAAEALSRRAGCTANGPGFHQIGAGPSISRVKMHRDLVPGEGRTVRY